MPEPDDDVDVTANLKVYPDEPPKSGTWVDVDEVIAHPTSEELEQGRQVGQSIDVDDEEDAGDPS